jgi:hypothetical protein
MRFDRLQEHINVALPATQRHMKIREENSIRFERARYNRFPQTRETFLFFAGAELKSEGNDDKILSIMTSNRELKNQPKHMFWSALHNDSLIQGDNDHPTPVFQHDSPTVDSNFR